MLIQTKWCLGKIIHLYYIYKYYIYICSHGYYDSVSSEVHGSRQKGQNIKCTQIIPEKKIPFMIWKSIPDVSLTLTHVKSLMELKF